MTFNWDSYQIIAKELFNLSKTNSSTKEAYLRSAISRAYYAAFCKARNQLAKRNVKIKKKNTHKFVIKSYLQSNSQEEKSIGNYLQKLRKNRNRADYANGNFLNIEKKAQAAIKKAERIIKKLANIDVK